MRKILMIFIFCLIFVSCNDLSKNEGNDSMNNFAIYTDEEGNAVLEEKKPIFNVNYTPNIIYTNKDGIDLSLQILTPKLKRNDTNSKYPLVLFIQGSRWMKQNVYQNLVVMGDFARRGYVVSISEYRPSDKAIFLAQIEDAREALDFMINNSDKYNVDTNNVFVWGTSSGAHTALFMAIPLSDNDTTIPYMNAIIAYYPPTDILEMRNDPLKTTTGDAESPEGILIGRKNVYDFPEEAKKASPYYEISKTNNLPPILLAHGDVDSVVPFSQSKILADKLKEENRVYEFYTVKNADHSGWQFWTKNMFDVVENFIKKYRK